MENTQKKIVVRINYIYATIKVVGNLFSLAVIHFIILRDVILDFSDLFNEQKILDTFLITVFLLSICALIANSLGKAIVLFRHHHTLVVIDEQGFHCEHNQRVPFIPWENIEKITIHTIRRSDHIDLPYVIHSAHDIEISLKNSDKKVLYVYYLYQSSRGIIVHTNYSARHLENKVNMQFQEQIQKYNVIIEQSHSMFS